MSLDIRHLTNGKKYIYVVRHTDTGKREIYNTREEIPKNIRHYADEGTARFTAPDLARILGVQDILYPNFPKCGMSEYNGEICIAELCKYAPNEEYTKCPYFDKNYRAQDTEN